MMRLALCSLALLAAPGLLRAGVPTVEKRLSSWGLRMDAEGFAVTEFSRREGRLLAQNGPVRLEITRKKTRQADAFRREKEVLLESLFEQRRSPYPDAITSVEGCAAEFQPQKRAVNGGTVYSLLAGERMNYGACSRDLARYRSRYGLWSCGGKELFEVKLFLPVESDANAPLDEIIETVSCR